MLAVLKKIGKPIFLILKAKYAEGNKKRSCCLRSKRLVGNEEWNARRDGKSEKKFIILS